MTKRKLAKLRRELESLRAGRYNLRYCELVRFAETLGRRFDPSRGKEPTYVSTPFPQLRPLSIPGHRNANPYTAGSILDSLEQDINHWEDFVEAEEAKKKNEKPKGLPPATIRKNSDSC